MSDEIEALKNRYINTDMDKYQFEKELERLQEEEEVSKQERDAALAWIYARKAKRMAIAFSTFILFALLAFLVLVFKQAAIVPIGIGVIGALLAWFVAHELG